ncbi:hypothetical protein EG328_008647 [Venturia inaequalis]|uniref:Uncharacterized protein n=1 Tax=Venturia inaequalis TaxID=5025 RepID=A0A8H3UA67_VENIN|nr:hypothetical protein EG328_008647 [Venturia inaequalis]
MATPACSSRTTQPVKDCPEASYDTKKGKYLSTSGHIQPNSILTGQSQNSVALGWNPASAVQQGNTISSLLPLASNQPLQAPNLVTDGSEILARLAWHRAQLNSPPYMESQKAAQSRPIAASSASVVTNHYLYAGGPISAPIIKLPKKSLRKPRLPRKQRLSKVCTPHVNVSRSDSPDLPHEHTFANHGNHHRVAQSSRPHCQSDPEINMLRPCAHQQSNFLNMQTEQLNNLNMQTHQSNTLNMQTEQLNNLNMQTHQSNTLNMQTHQSSMPNIPMQQSNMSYMQPQQFNIINMQTQQPNIIFSMQPQQSNMSNMPIQQFNTLNMPTQQLNTLNMQTPQSNMSNMPTQQFNTLNMQTPQFNTSNMPTQQFNTLNMQTPQSNMRNTMQQSNMRNTMQQSNMRSMPTQQSNSLNMQITPQQEVQQQAPGGPSRFNEAYKIMLEHNVKPAMRDWKKYTIGHIRRLEQQIPGRSPNLSRYYHLGKFSLLQHQTLQGIVKWEEINITKLGNHMMQLSSQLLEWRSRQSNKNVHNRPHPHTMTFEQLDHEVYQDLTMSPAERSRHTRCKNQLCLYQLPSQVEQIQNGGVMQPHTAARPAEKRKHAENDEGAEEQPSSKRPRIQPVSNTYSPSDHSHTGFPQPKVNTSAQVDNGLLTPESMSSPGVEMHNFVDHVQPKVNTSAQVNNGLLTPESMPSPGVEMHNFVDHVQPQFQHQHRQTEHLEAEKPKAIQIEADQIRQAEEAPTYQQVRDERKRKNDAMHKAFLAREAIKQEAEAVKQKEAENERLAKLKREAEIAAVERKKAAQENATKLAEQERKKAEKAKLEADRLKAENDRQLRLAEEKAAAPRLCDSCQVFAEELHDYNKDIAVLEVQHAKLHSPLLRNRIQKQIEAYKHDIRQLAENSDLKIQDDGKIEPYWQCKHFMQVESELEQDDNDDDDNDSSSLSGDDEDGGDNDDDTAHNHANNESEGTSTANDTIELDQSNSVDDERPENEDEYDFEAEFAHYLDESGD